jgi:hypothetical protein
MSSIQSLSRFLAAALLVAAGVFWTGCDSSGGSMSPAQGQFTLRLTDAPAQLDSAVVTVDRVDLVSSDAEDEMDDDDGDDDGEDEEEGESEETEGVITLTDSTQQIDLLRLQGGITETLADVTVPEGEYTQLRFVLGDENYVITTEGAKQSLQVPSGKQSGIKIVLPEVEIENDGDRLAVTLDFDVEESFVQQGNGQYLFKPTIKVKSVSVDGQPVQAISAEGAISAATSNSVSVDSIPFALGAQTEYEGVSGASGLQAGQSIEVEGTLLDDGTFEAREVSVEDDEIERSITAPVQSVSSSDSTLAQLGVTMRVTDSTEFDDEGSLGDVASGGRVETEYIFDGADRIATEIENEDD